jgi:hypothetical protein
MVDYFASLAIIFTENILLACPDNFFLYSFPRKRELLLL